MTRQQSRDAARQGKPFGSGRTRNDGRVFKREDRRGLLHEQPRRGQCDYFQPHGNPETQNGYDNGHREDMKPRPRGFQLDRVERLATEGIRGTDGNIRGLQIFNNSYSGGHQDEVYTAFQMDGGLMGTTRHSDQIARAAERIQRETNTDRLWFMIGPNPKRVRNRPLQSGESFAEGAAALDHLSFAQTQPKRPSYERARTGLGLEPGEIPRRRRSYESDTARAASRGRVDQRGDIMDSSGTTSMRGDPRPYSIRPYERQDAPVYVNEADMATSDPRASYRVSRPNGSDS